MTATELMEAHKEFAWEQMIRSFEIHEVTGTTARSLFMAGWDAAMLQAAIAIRRSCPVCHQIFATTSAPATMPTPPATR